MGTPRQRTPPMQTADNQVGEIEFRKKLARQQVTGELVLDGEMNGQEILPILRERVDKTVRDIRALAEQGIDEEALRCPDAPPGTQGYAMNSEVGGKRISEIASPAGTPLLFDSTLTGPNAHDNLSSLPSPGRHQGKNYVLFADGQVGSR